MFEKAVKNMQLHKVQEAEIQKAEERMKVKLPDDLLHFYRMYGYGFVNNELHAVISFGESMLPDHVVEFTIDKFTIKSDLLMG